MEKKFTNSLIISTYNWPQALELCLLSVMQQKILPDEIIIADDGSTNETKLLIESYAVKFSIPIKHVWHEDKGFRLAAIRNKAIAQASSDYIIQIDGDLILHPLFIKDHLLHAEKNYFVTGSRVMLQEQLTKNVLLNKRISFTIYTPGSGNFFNGLRSNFLRVLFSKTYKTHGKNKYYVKGCNMAFWRTDLLEVNGYNESFIGWGQEDSDIAVRLMNARIKKKFIKMAAIVYHLYHNQISRKDEAGNLELMRNALINKNFKTEKGLNQYLIS